MAYISRQTPAAGSYLVQLAQKLNSILNRTRTRIRSEILSLVLFQFTRKEDSREVLITCNLYIRICLVILEHCIILRLMLLDEIIFKNKCLKLRIGDYIFKIAYMTHHLLNLLSMISRRLKILAYSVLKAYRLADIDYVVMVVMHYIDSRFTRKLL